MKCLGWGGVKEAPFSMAKDVPIAGGEKCWPGPQVKCECPMQLILCGQPSIHDKPLGEAQSNLCSKVKEQLRGNFHTQNEMEAMQSVEHEEVILVSKPFLSVLSVKPRTSLALIMPKNSCLPLGWGMGFP